MEEAQAYLKKLLNFNDCVVVAVSGGPDSMALLHLLIMIKKDLDLKIVCAHVNHNVRKESEKEKCFVEKYCKDNQIIFEYMKIAKKPIGNFESEARKIRYDFFDKIVQKHSAKYLLTAHHGDDLIETILMRIVRGTNLNGYSGFKKETKLENYSIIRPLITETKQDIEKYLKSNKIEYVIDKSNFSENYTRNRYRKYMLPFLKKENPNVHEKFLDFSEELDEYNNYVEKQIIKVFEKIYKDKQLTITKLKNEEKFMQKQLLYKFLEQEYQDTSKIKQEHIELILKLIDSKKANAYIFLPGKQLVKEYDVLKFEDIVDEPSKYDYLLESQTNLPNGKNIEKIEFSEDNSNFICRLNSGSIKMPLHVRSKKEGDKISIMGMSGSKKIKDIFIDEKIAKKDRDLWPVVVDSNNEIVWLPGLKKSNLNKAKNQKCDIILKYY